ncbi:MAG: T9SS type A sorting domain-containing protein [Flavobacteriales bacterium]
MRKYSLFILVSIFVLPATAQNSFSYSYDIQAWSAYASRGYFKKLANQGYLLSFNRADTAAVYGVYPIVKMASNGQVQWSKTITGLSPGLVAETPDSGFVLPIAILRDTLNYINTSGVCKIDKNGNVRWVRLYGDSSTISHQIHTVSINNGIFFMESVYDPVTYYSDLILHGTDTAGSIAWSRRIDIDSEEIATYAIPTYDNNILIAGYMGTQDFFMAKVDASNGSLIWCKKYPAANSAHPMYVIEDAQHNLVLTGRSWTWGAGDWDIFLIKTDEDGNFIFGKTFGGTNPDEGYSVLQTSDGGYLICAEPESFSFSISQTALIKTDNNGIFSWMKLLNPQVDGTFPFGAVLNSDQSVTIFGIKNSWGYPDEITLTRTSPTLNTGCMEQNIIPQLSSFSLVPFSVGSSVPWGGQRSYTLTDSFFIVTPAEYCVFDNVYEIDSPESSFYPNPFSESSEIYIQRLAGLTCCFNLYSATGECVRKMENINDGRIKINRTGLSNGFYFYEFVNKGKTLTRGKVVIR